MTRDRATREEEKKPFRVVCLKCRDWSPRSMGVAAEIWMNEHNCPAQQETGSRSKRHPDVVKGEGE